MLTNHQQRLVIETGKLVLGFQTDKYFAWDLISDTERKTALFNKPGKEDSIWSLEVKQPDETLKVIKACEADWMGAELVSQNEEGLHFGFDWQYTLAPKAVLKIRVNVKVEQGSNLSCWNIEVTPPKGYILRQVDFPLISYFPSGKGIKMAMPHGWGLEYDLHEGAKNEGFYPSCLANMQFVGVYDKKGNGLYIGAHDKKAYHKEFALKAGKTAAELRVINYVGVDPKKPSKAYKLPFDIIIGAYKGGWREAGMIYRDFSFSTKWGNIPTISKRNIPQWLKDTDLWIRPDGDVESNLADTEEALQFYAGIPTALHWYRWHKIPYDTLYPEYFPTKPNFAKQVKYLQDKYDVKITPYINGRLWDPATKSWKTKKAFDSACLKEGGGFFTEFYATSNVANNPMCPTTPLWQQTVRDMVQKIIKETYVNGVYIDQIGASWPHRCVNEKHGHLLGGGCWWYEGYRKMLDGVRKVLPKNHIITTEENAECWIDQFDAQLTLNMHASEGKWIPLYPLVYGDRVLSFGFLYYKPEDYTKGLPFRVKMQKCLLYGSQLGWCFPKGLMAPEARPQAEFMKDLALVRKYAHDFIAGGRLIDLVEVSGKNPKIKGEGVCIFGPKYLIDQKAVEGTLWLGESGKLGVLLANVADQECMVTVQIPKDLVPPRSANGRKFTIYTAAGKIALGKVENYQVKMRMPASGGALIVIG